MLACSADRIGLLADAGLHRLLQRCRQLRIGRFGALVELLLAGLQAFVVGLVLLLQVAHHGLQALDQGRHQRVLFLQQAEGLAALEALRMHAQLAGDAGIQLLHGLRAFAAQQG